jgi:hypothetical protein
MDSNKTSSKIDQTKIDDAKTSMLKKTIANDSNEPLITGVNPKLTLEGRKTITLGKKATNS